MQAVGGAVHRPFCIINNNDTCYTLRIVTIILQKVFYAALIHDCLRGSVRHKTDFRK